MASGTVETEIELAHLSRKGFKDIADGLHFLLDNVAPLALPSPPPNLEPVTDILSVLSTLLNSARIELSATLPLLYAVRNAPSALHLAKHLPENTAQLVELGERGVEALTSASRLVSSLHASPLKEYVDGQPDPTTIATYRYRAVQPVCKCQESLHHTPVEVQEASTQPLAATDAVDQSVAVSSCSTQDNDSDHTGAVSPVSPHMCWRCLRRFAPQCAGKRVAGKKWARFRRRHTCQASPAGRKIATGVLLGLDSTEGFSKTSPASLTHAPHAPPPSFGLLAASDALQVVDQEAKPGAFVNEETTSERDLMLAQAADILRGSDGSHQTCKDRDEINSLDLYEQSFERTVKWLGCDASYVSTSPHFTTDLDSSNSSCSHEHDSCVSADKDELEALETQISRLGHALNEQEVRAKIVLGLAPQGSDGVHNNKRLESIGVPVMGDDEAEAQASGVQSLDMADERFAAEQWLGTLSSSRELTRASLRKGLRQAIRRQVSLMHGMDRLAAIVQRSHSLHPLSARSSLLALPTFKGPTGLPLTPGNVDENGGMRDVQPVDCLLHHLDGLSIVASDELYSVAEMREQDNGGKTPLDSSPRTGSESGNRECESSGVDVSPAPSSLHNKPGSSEHGSVFSDEMFLPGIPSCIFLLQAAQDAP